MILTHNNFVVAYITFNFSGLFCSFSVEPKRRLDSDELLLSLESFLL